MLATLPFIRTHFSGAKITWFVLIPPDSVHSAGGHLLPGRGAEGHDPQHVRDLAGDLPAEKSEDGEKRCSLWLAEHAGRRIGERGAAGIPPDAQPAERIVSPLFLECPRESDCFWSLFAEKWESNWSVFGFYLDWVHLESI